MSQQLVKKGANGRMVNVNPKSWIEAIKDKNTGQTLVEILQGFNMYFLPYNGNTTSTRCLVPTMLRKKGLWITYVKYDGNVYTEWYAADELDDKSWGDSSNWRIGNNTLVGDITISANGNWVINGTETEFKAVGEKGNTPLIRVANNRLQVSYDLGDTYIDVTNNPVYTKFRWYGTTGDTQANNVGRIQASTDEGKTWTNMSNDFTNNLHIKKYIGVNESLPTSGIAEGTIYAKGPYYDEGDTLNDNPIYRLWVYAWKGNTLAWQDNGEFQSIAAGVVQETGDSETEVMSQKAVTEKLSELGQYVENPEYARAYTDAEGRFLWGIKQDGSIEFAKGVPTPIKNYIVEFVINRIDNAIIPEIEALKETHEQYLKESESIEWARVIVDAEGKVLWGIRQDGSVEFTKGIPSSIKKYIDNLDRNNDEEVERINQLVIGLLNDVKVLTDTYHYISNPEWACAIVDSEEHILMGIKTDGSYYIPNRDMYHVESNPEYAKAVIDSEGRVLFGIKVDGSCYIPKGISEEAKQGLLELTSRISLFENIFSNIENPEWFSITTDSDGKILEGIEKGGKKYFPKQEMLEKYNDIEGRAEMTLDADGHIISYRDNSGVKHESKQHTNEASFDTLELSENNGKQIAESLKKVGFTTDFPSDFSLSEFIELPIPRVAAKVRLLVPKMPTTKTADIEGFLEYNDKDGNYFKKPIVLNSQGSSSMSYIRPDGSQGNLGVDFVDCEIKFGTWVSQDSFHIKKYYIDAFRGQCVVGYHLMEQVYQTHPYGSKHPYEPNISFGSFSTSSGSIKRDFNTGALCHPDGFPIVIYVNTGGEDVFYGVYAWCLKKHRDNYYCDKKNPNNIILDGLITTNTLFGGSVNWSEFEIRNPKDLIDINGEEYDGENPKELSDTDELSKNVKDNINRLSGVLNALKANNSRSTFEQYFIPTYYIDYYIISQVLYNVDGFHKNWIWCTWDGQHWTPTLYDVDSIFGMMPIGTYVREETANGVLISETITNYLASLYKDEIEERYKELRDKGVFTVDNIVGLLDSWLKRVGYSNLKDDLEKFNQTPSYRSSKLNKSNWKIINYSWDANKNDYDNEKTYETGGRCYSYGYELEAITQSVGVPPFKDVYSNHPRANGFYNSLLRVKNWVEKRLNFLDSQYNYSY